MTLAETLTLASYFFFVLIILAFYGWHRYYLVYMYMKNRDRQPKPGPQLSPLPVVTVQLPLYNEMYVADRLIEAVCALDYPRELLEIQVLDDSTDETASIAEAPSAALPPGLRHQVLPPDDRSATRPARSRPGSRARGEFVAIFDADFLPSPTSCSADARTSRIANRDGAGALGPHQPGLLAADEDPVDPARRTLRARARRAQPGRRFFNFNGTAGVWRRAAIDDAGGWQHDTLTEDLDLSYRAQLRGWQFVFVPDLIAPAEVPVEMKRVQVAAAPLGEGSIQTCRKLLPHDSARRRAASA
jgi:cellulose synthase/poly-beta-1,6-N-acetylglucosamine synthase-like glycosyltransferase